MTLYNIQETRIFIDTIDITSNINSEFHFQIKMLELSFHTYILQEFTDNLIYKCCPFVKGI